MFGVGNDPKKVRKGFGQNQIFVTSLMNPPPPKQELKLTVSQSTPSSSTRSLMSSGMAMAGCVSFNWMATFSGNLLKSLREISRTPNLECLNLKIVSKKSIETLSVYKTRFTK